MSEAEFYEQHSGVAMTCRSYKEYEEMFMFDDCLFKKGRVLDAASGGSSFIAELTKKGYDAVAVDPLYRLSVEEMNAFGYQEIEIASQKLEKVKHIYEWVSYESLDMHNDIRRHSFQKFLESYKQDVKKEKYIAASLTSLPFENDTFSLVVCNHFLFLYQEQFDFNFHLKAIEEMIRVTKVGGSIRIYPLVDFKSQIYTHLDELIDAINTSHASAKIKETPFRFLPSAHHFLQIDK
nr:methyltransferase domain-containing protein [uncultured Bacillus sp.]